MNAQQHSLKAVVFDVDGTLLDSVDIHAQAWVDAFAEFGHEVRFGDVRRQIGKGGDQLMPVFLSMADIERLAKSSKNAAAPCSRNVIFTASGRFPPCGSCSSV